MADNPEPGAANQPDQRASPARAGKFPIVGVGASAGGLEAFSQLLAHLPLDTGMAFVLVQHLDPDHESALTQLLGRVTSLPVVEVTNNLRVQPNHVYVIPPNTSLGIARGKLTLQPRPKTRTPHRSVDFFFEALAADQREQAVGVILSGTASDGTLGLEAIKAEGGITFAQDETARHDSMPRSAIAAGCVDFVLPPSQIAAELGRIAKHPAVTGAAGVSGTPEDDRVSATAHVDDATPLPSGGRGSPRTGSRQARAEAERDSTPEAGGRGTEDGYKRILFLLRNHSGVDFSLYKSSTIQRRITRRMVLSKQDTLERYAQSLRGNTKELDALYSDTLISVTSFFRNPDAFDVLQRRVWPALLQQPGDDPLRVWVLGCSTGQEAYSHAMAFVEAAEQSPRTRTLQVFATDLNNALLDKARHGLYSTSLAQDLSPERLQRFFVAEEGGYRVVKSLREMVVFARQNVISDPPFSRIDLISCRNLLIYFEPGLQQRVFPVFHYALKPGGYLCLGASESIGGFTELFEPVDKKHKIYVKKAAPTPAFRLPARPERVAAPASGAREADHALFPAAQGGADAGVRAELSAQREADRVTVNQFAPPAVLINNDLQVLQFRGPTGAFLEPPTGKASFDVLKMARTGLMLPLRAAINKAKKDNTTVRERDIRLVRDGETRTIGLAVIPLKNLLEPSFLIVFEDEEKAGAPARVSPVTPATAGGVETAPDPLGAASRRIVELEHDLAETRDYLGSIQEQHEAGHEELQASNEEVQSANEELQSINEELETSKEELESSNEELATVNEEMANRNLELNGLNNDLVNIQTSAHVAIVLLGRNLAIRRFSVQAEKAFDLTGTDIGRRFTDVRHKLQLPDFDAIVANVIETARPSELEVQNREGCWFSLRVRPYVTHDHKVDGAVLVLVDITDLKRSEQAVANARDYAENIIATVREPLVVLDASLRIETANRAFYETFGATPGGTIGEFIHEVGDGQWDRPELRTLLEDVLVRNHSVKDFPLEQEVERLGRRAMLLDARPLRDSQGRTGRILLAIEDITERRRSDEAFRRHMGQFESLLNAVPFGVYLVGADFRIRLVNPHALPVFGDVPDLVGRDFDEVIHILWPKPYADEIVELFRHTLETGEPFATSERVEQRLDRGVTEAYEWHINRVPLGEGYGVVCSFRDISVQVRALAALRQHGADLAEADRHKDEFLAMLAHELRSPLAPIRNSLEILRRARSGAPPALRAGAPIVESEEVSVNPDQSIDAAVEILERQVGQMVRLVDDLLDANRISRGKLRLRKERVELSSVIYYAVESSRPLCEARSQELTVALPTEAVYLDADPTRLAQIVSNLLNNASKFSERGGSISVTVDGVEEGASEVVIRVRDSGIGIEASQLPRVFDMFMQVDTSLERSVTGLGIGLTLVKTLVQMHGGTIDVYSEGLGEGSEFVVRLPIAGDPTSMMTSPPRAVVPTRALRILVVDDNHDSAESLSLLLRFQGHQTDIANDGLEAVAAAARLRPEVILLDIGLPGINGYEAARRIREQQAPGARPTIVALTGWGQEEDRRRSEEAGFDAHLVKPVNLEVLMGLLSGLPAGARPRPVRPPHDPPPTVADPLH